MVCVWAGSPMPLVNPPSPSTGTIFCSLVNGLGEDDVKQDDDEYNVEMAESLHSTCPFSTLLALGVRAALAPRGCVISTAVLMETVAEHPYFLIQPDAWQ